MDKTQADILQQTWLEQDEALYNFVLTEILKTYEGRKFLFHWLGQTRLAQNPFSSNALQMSFNCGEQNVGQKYLAHILSVNPELYVQMQQEANDERRKRDQQLSGARDALTGFGPDS